MARLCRESLDCANSATLAVARGPDQDARREAGINIFFFFFFFFKNACRSAARQTKKTWFENEKGEGRVARWNARKRIRAHEDLAPEHRLKRSLAWPHLVALGVGAIVGTGILTLTGVGAAKAGRR